MHTHLPLSILVVGDDIGERPLLLLSYLEDIPHISCHIESQVPEELTDWNVVLTFADDFSPHAADRLTTFAGAGGGWLHFVTPSAAKLPPLFGVQPKPAGPKSELRVLFNDRNHPLGTRLPDAIYVEEDFHPLVLESDGAEIMLYTDWHFQHHAVLVGNLHGDGRTACTTLTDFRHPVMRQIFFRLIRDLGGQPTPEGNVNVGILGYAPSVGAYHGKGIAETAGLKLQSVCDLSLERLEQAKRDFPGIRFYSAAEALGRDPDVDLVIIATPPNTHADLSLKMMAAGKHVVCEKPLALSVEETDAMVEASRREGVHLGCHQNRRWDADYLAIKNALDRGDIGELFYLETFVGGFSHPCGYWHSDSEVSGGMTYDWGAHYIDWMVGLCSERIETVMGTRHKRVWHDVTNADQERIQMRFHGGMEAEFIHSDIAALRKPKWYLLGTQGAIVGEWQDITEYQIDPIHYFRPHHIPATEMPPRLTLSKHQGAGHLTSSALTLPDRPIFGFHRNLADHLLVGEPLVAPLADSLRVVAVLEAAARSIKNGGRREVVDV